MAKLLLKFHNTVLKEIPLDQEQVWIGRKSDNMVVIDNPAVSAQHARVKEENGAYYLEDLASTNGTFLNDKRVDRELLRNGDQIRVGKHLLVYQDISHHPERPQDAMPSASDLDKTMVLEAAKPRVLPRSS
ncbi:MAG: FHA domain-containing protein, partial [Nitrospirales bacterium]